MARLTVGRLSGSIRSMKPRLNQQRGGASLLVTVVLALLLLGVVGGLTTLSVRELRQASNTEQSNRALTAAESYVSTLANQFVSTSNPAYNSNCATKDLGNNLKITCATVTAGSGDAITGKPERDETFRMEVKNQAVASFAIDWSNESDLMANIGLYNPAAYAAGWPAQADLEDKDAPAALETTLVWWQSGTITPANAGDTYGLPLKKYLVKPSQTNGPIATTCGLPRVDGYLCRTTSPVSIKAITGANTASNLVLKLTPRYSGTSFRLRFYDAGGNLLTVPLPYATIDVTARANNLYRRVVAQKLLDPTSTFSFLDGNVLFSGANICKDLKVGADNNGVNGGDGTNSVPCQTVQTD